VGGLKEEIEWATRGARYTARGKQPTQRGHKIINSALRWRCAAA